jgi:beta-lactam-binding protein with PASTA domain
MKRVVLALALVAAAVLTRPLNVSTQTNPAQVGQWSAVQTWPSIGVHAHLLNSGKVLAWEEGSQATLWDPATRLFTPVPAPWVDLLCAGHTFLADGRLLTVGGWDRSGAGLGLNEADIFEPNIQAWIRARPMAFKRWYPTGTRLPDGRVLVVSGARNSLTDIVNIPEVYDPTNDTWTSLTAATRAIPMYPFLFVLPDGRVISVGNSEVPNRTQALDVATQTWTVIDSRAIEGGAAVMFAPGKFMKAGTSADSGDSGVSGATSFVLDMTDPVPAWKPTGSMSFPRSFHNLTMLPDGTTLVTGGGTDKSAFINSNGVLPAELWSPVTGTWTTLASMVTSRLYHSTALLLPDARVLVAGGGADSGVQDHPNAEIFSPPYLFKGTRPTIASTPSTLTYGAKFTIATPDGASIASVALVSPGSVTHGFNQDQRFVNLEFQTTPNGLSVTTPANPNLAPPGHYLIFIVNGSGVPSVAAFVNLPITAVQPQVAVPSVVNQTQASAAAEITAAGLTVGTVTTASSATVPAGSVISQAPIAGTLVASGSAVALVVSSGAAPVAVPTVIGQTQASAAAEITAAGLTVGAVTTAPSATVPAGSVISQNPIAGTQVASGSAVALVVSSGAALVSVPSVVNATQAAATTTITSAGLTVGAVTTASSPTIPVGSVISQNPAAGSLVSAGTAVALVVSTGPVSVALTVDTMVFDDGNGTAVTPAFSTAAVGELLVAFAASDGPTTAKQTLTVSGAGLTWSLKQRSNTQLGTSEIWTATASAALVNATVTATQAIGGFDQSLTVVAFRGAGGTGAAASAGALSGAPSVSLTTTRAGSLVYGVGNDWNAAIARTLGASQTLVHQWVDTAVGDTFWVQSRTAPVSTAGSVATINDTAPTTDQWNLAAIEILTSTLPQVTVPNVAGLTQAAATTAITNAGLTVGTVTTASSTTVPAGSVISQTPIAGTQVATGSAVALIVSTGLPQVAVPTVVGLTPAAAAISITNAGLTVGTVTTASSTTVPAGSVISQTPIAGTQVASGSAVALVVSTGLPQVAVPSVVGLTQAAAMTSITNAGLTVGTVTTASSTTVPAGSVISQTPIAGTQVATGSAVALVVSSGLPQVATPNVVGLTQAAATTSIINAGLAVGTVTTASSTTVPAGSVISQTPVAGTQVATGSAVALVVSTGLPQIAVPSVVGLTQAAATISIANAGLTVGTVTTASSTTVPAGSVISQTPVAGTQVATGSAVALVVSSGVPQVATPNVVGLTQGAATTAIANAGLTVGAITTASSITVPAGSVITQNPVAGTVLPANSAVALVVSSGASPVALAVDRVVFSDGSGTRVTPSFSTTTAGELLVAFASAAGPTSTSLPQTVTVAGAGLTWTLVKRANAQFGTAEVWSAPAPARLTNVTVTATASRSGFDQSLTVVAFVGAEGTGATGGASAAFGPSTASLTTTRAGSFVYGVGNDSARAVSRTLGANQTMTHQFVDFAVNQTFWVQSISSPVADGTVATINDAAPTSDRWNLATVEILATAFAPTPAVVPDVVGQSEAEATSALADADLTVGKVTFESSTTVPAGSVIDQTPAAGTQVVAGSAVALAVSSGLPQVTAPNVVGLTEAEAAIAITGADLTVGAVTTAASATVPAGWVISQNPAAGAPLEPGSAVALVVSSGPAQVATPNVVGLSQPAAVAEITNAGLSVGTVTLESSTTVPAGSVISQAPIAGTHVATGTAVAIAVSTGPPLISVPNVVGLTEAAATSAIAGAGLTVGTRVLEASTTVPVGSVVRQTPSAGVQLILGGDVDLVVSSGPSAGLALDMTVSSNGSGTRTSPSFSTAEAGELLLAFVAAEGPSGTQAATVSGAGLTWTLVRRSNTQDGTSEVWKATAPARLINVTVTSTLSSSLGMDQSLTVAAFTGAAGVGASAIDNDSRTAPSVSLTTTRAGSLVWGVGNDPIRRTARTPGANQSIVHQWVNDNANETFWVQSRNTPVATAGTVATINDIAPTNGDWNLAAVEIIPR